MPPTRWEASQRPLFVRTVWVAGARHAILSHDDPAKRIDTNNIARRPKRRTLSASTIKSGNRTRTIQSETKSTVEACLFNKSLELPAEESPRENLFTERVYQWLEAAGKIRPPTPFEGALWESPRDNALDISAGSLKLATKNVDLNVTCTPIGRRDSNVSLETRPPSPGFVQTFTPPKHINPKKCVSGTRPQLHIFMPLVQPVHRTSIDSRV